MKYFHSNWITQKCYISQLTHQNGNTIRRRYQKLINFLEKDFAEHRNNLFHLLMIP